MDFAGIPVVGGNAMDQLSIGHNGGVDGKKAAGAPPIRTYYSESSPIHFATK
jgi:hypothetical protein